MYTFNIDEDITKAETLPASFYRDETIFDALKEQVFLKTWQWVGDINLVSEPQSVHPFILLDSFLTEPMLLSKDKDNEIHCLTNVCTHRGNIMAIDYKKYINKPYATH